MEMVKDICKSGHKGWAVLVVPGSYVGNGLVGRVVVLGHFGKQSLRYERVAIYCEQICQRMKR
jgi:hypothetical protein